MMGRKQGQVVRTAGAWLVTKHEDGTTGREALLTFNPFARPGCKQGSDGPRDKARSLAWARERTRCRRAGLSASVARPPRAGSANARPPRLTGPQLRAIHALARARAAERERARAAAIGAVPR